MSNLTDIAISLFLVIGGGFGLTGSWGLLRLRDPMQRLHAPTKASTMGVGAVLMASMLAGWAVMDSPSWHEVLVTVFLFLTAPLTALYLAKTHLHRTIKQSSIPPTGTGVNWAGHDSDHDF